MGWLNLSANNYFLLSMAICALIGGIVVYKLRRDVEDDDGSTDPADLLKGFEKAYYAGEMDEAEFRRVTAALETQKAADPGSPKRAAPIVMPPEPVPSPPPSPNPADAPQ